MTYDDLYSKGGFNYRPNQFNRYVTTVLLDRLGMSGKVLDAPCGDGYFSRLLRRYGMNVLPTDISKIGSAKANGIRWNLEQLNREWIDQFDWVFSRAITHLHHKDLSPAFRVFDNLLCYAPKVLVIYHTTQTGKYRGPHFNHTRASLDDFFSQIDSFESFVWRGYYHAVINPNLSDTTTATNPEYED